MVNIVDISQLVSFNGILDIRSNNLGNLIFIFENRMKRKVRKYEIR